MNILNKFSKKKFFAIFSCKISIARFPFPLLPRTFKIFNALIICIIVIIISNPDNSELNPTFS